MIYRKFDKYSPIFVNIGDIFYLQIDVHYYSAEWFLKYMYIELKNSIIEYHWHNRNFWNFSEKKVLTLRTERIRLVEGRNRCLLRVSHCSAEDDYTFFRI